MQTEAYSVVRINLRNAPSSTLLSNSLPSVLFPCIIQIPTIELPLRLRGLISKSIKLLNITNFAGPLSDAFIYIACLVLTIKIEAHECEVPASQTD